MMFLRRCFLSSTCFQSLPSLCRFSSGLPPLRKEFVARTDRRPFLLCDRVAFLIRMSDLDTAAKHARLAPYPHTDDLDFCPLDWVVGAIIVAMCKAKRYKDALDLIHYFFNQYKIIPPKQSFNNVFKAVLDDPSTATMTLIRVRRLAQAGSFDEALDPFKKHPPWMEPFAKHLDVSNILIRGLLDLGDFHEAHKLFRKIMMANEYMNRTALAAATFMEYWFKHGKEDEAMECYSNLLAMEELKDIRSTGANALLEVLLKYDKKTQAWAFFHHLLNMETPNFYVHTIKTTMVNECFKLGRVSHAIQTFKLPSANPRVSASAGFGNIIVKLCELGLLTEAENFCKEMQKDCTIEPDLSAYRALMDAYVKSGRVADVHRISNTMVDAFLSQVAQLSRLSLEDP
ncbi:hypothetical protein N665_2485s0008 [Sinapis alba]|nr:hypothetical protein N665_2485s0008 [Sinapis alba]